MGNKYMLEELELPGRNFVIRCGKEAGLDLDINVPGRKVYVIILTELRSLSELFKIASRGVQDVTGDAHACLI